MVGRFLLTLCYERKNNPFERTNCNSTVANPEFPTWVPSLMFSPEKSYEIENNLFPFWDIPIQGKISVGKENWMHNQKVAHIFLLVHPSNSKVQTIKAGRCGRVVSMSHCQVGISRLSPASYLCWNTHVGKVTGCRTGCQEVSVAPKMNLTECTSHMPLPKKWIRLHTLALKPRGDVTTSPKQGHQWSQKGHVPTKIKITNKIIIHQNPIKDLATGENGFLIWTGLDQLRPMVEISTQLIRINHHY